jgi:hypothetical protein
VLGGAPESAAIASKRRRAGSKLRPSADAMPQKNISTASAEAIMMTTGPPEVMLLQN